MKQIILIMIASMIVLPAHADTLATTKSIANIAASCTVNMGNFNFGNIIPGQSSANASNSINVLCTKQTSYSITFIFHVWGQDCTYLQGQGSGDRFYYYATTDQNVYVGNSYPQNEVGTGLLQTFNYVAKVQPASVPAWNNYSACHGAVYGSYMPKNPGYNPYVTPDTYTDNNQVQISY